MSPPSAHVPEEVDATTTGKQNRTSKKLIAVHVMLLATIAVLGFAKATGVAAATVLSEAAVSSVTPGTKKELLHDVQVPRPQLLLFGDICAGAVLQAKAVESHKFMTILFDDGLMELTVFTDVYLSLALVKFATPRDPSGEKQIQIGFGSRYGSNGSRNGSNYSLHVQTREYRRLRGSSCVAKTLDTSTCFGRRSGRTCITGDGSVKDRRRTRALKTLRPSVDCDFFCKGFHLAFLN